LIHFYKRYSQVFNYKFSKVASKVRFRRNPAGSSEEP